MAIALSIFGIVFAALCVWLGVRIVNRRERWAKWTAIVIVALFLYVLSIGPVIWLESRGMLNETMTEAAIWVWYPCLLLIEDPDDSGAICPALGRYADLWFGSR